MLEEIGTWGSLLSFLLDKWDFNIFIKHTDKNEYKLIFGDYKNVYYVNKYLLLNKLKNSKRK